LAPNIINEIGGISNWIAAEMEHGSCTDVPQARK
jgi:hypothetical protein